MIDDQTVDAPTRHILVKRPAGAPLESGLLAGWTGLASVFLVSAGVVLCAEFVAAWLLCKRFKEKQS
jgi:hypothetical protein